jgi:hypothetical protein
VATYRAQLTEPQHQFVFSQSKFPALIGGLGSGKSQGGTYRVARLMLEDPGINCGYYFPTYDLINLRGIPGLCRDFETLGITKYTVNRSEYYIDIEGYGRVIFRSYERPERIVAYEVAHSIVDELDTLPRDKAEMVWRKVVERNRQRCKHPAGNTVGCVTTPDQGQLGFVFEKWGAVELQDGYELIKASTYSNPFNPPDYADSILKNYDEDLARCYLEGDFVSLAHRTVFNRRDMEKAMKECFKPTKRMVLEKKKWVERDDGELRVWAEPKPGSRYVIGADVAEGLVDGDYSVCDVVEVSTGYQVAQWHGKIAPDLYANVLMELGNWYSKAEIACENNNHGLLVNVLMRDAGYPNIYVQTTSDDRGSGEKETRRLGFTTTSRSKPYIMDHLSSLLREGSHGIACTETVKEMMTYVIDEKGSYNAIVGCYDDRVMSYAITCYLLQQSPAYKRKAA